MDVGGSLVWPAWLAGQARLAALLFQGDWQLSRVGQRQPALGVLGRRCLHHGPQSNPRSLLPGAAELTPTAIMAGGLGPALSVGPQT